MTPTDLRLQLLRLGYLPLPLYGKEPPNRKNNKHGGLSDWPNLRATHGLILMWDKKWPDAHNSGVITAPVPAFDGDITHPEAARAVEDLVRERYEEVGRLLVRFGNPPKFAIPFRTDEPFEKLSVKLKAPDGTEHKIEFLCDGQQVVVDGIHPDTGKPYSWHGGTLVETPREELPSITKAEAQQLVDDAVDLTGQGFSSSHASTATGWSPAFHNALLRGAAKSFPPSTAAANPSLRMSIHMRSKPLTAGCPAWLAVAPSISRVRVLIAFRQKRLAATCKKICRYHPEVSKTGVCGIWAILEWASVRQLILCWNSGRARTLKMRRCGYANAQA